MGRIAFERQIHVKYVPPFREMWNSQTQEVKTFCDDYGKPFGYSGQNVFFFYLIYLLMKDKGYIFKDFKHTL